MIFGMECWPKQTDASSSTVDLDMYVLAVLSVLVPLSVFKRNLEKELIVWEGLVSTTLSTVFSIGGLYFHFWMPQYRHLAVAPNLAHKLTAIITACVTIKLVTLMALILPAKYGGKHDMVLGVSQVAVAAASTAAFGSDADTGASYPAPQPLPAPQPFVPDGVNG